VKMPDSVVVFDAAAIDGALDRVAAAITRRCAGDEWLAVCILNGGLMFTSEIMKRVRLDLRLDAIRVSRYHDTTSGHELHWHAKPVMTGANQNVLLLDDIFDEGETMAALMRFYTGNGARQVVSAVLLEKAHNRKAVNCRPDIVGLTCPDHYVFGFGMDHEGYFRNLPEIRRLA
jgi:hypoxanthine phosphoribosyltransferase